MCQWALMTLVDVARTFEYLAYLGYNVYEGESQLSAVQGMLITKGIKYTNNMRSTRPKGRKLIDQVK